MTRPSALTAAQRKALKKIQRDQFSTPAACGVSWRTFSALERRGLIRVRTTLSAIAFPRTSAEATITPAGRAALEGPEGDRK